MRFNRKVILSIVLALSALSAASQSLTDSLAAAVDSVARAPVKPSSTLWIKQLIDNGFHINDENVAYPKFPLFLRNVYNWGDKVFNSYDPEYVVSTGKNWKLQGKSYNWMQTYAFIFPRRKVLHMNSDLYGDVGAYLSFMAVTVGYTFNANELIAKNNNKRSRFNLNFTCSLFTADYTRTSTSGGAKITRFGDFENGGHISVPFEDVSNTTTTATAYYFFNHRKYSHAAAYCYSKYQLKSAGTWIVGLTYNNQNVEMSFEKLPPNLLAGLPPDAPLNYRFHYTDYIGIGGYAYNWVLKPKTWLLNATGLIGVGYKHTAENSTDGRRDMVASETMLKLSMVYNHRALFTSLDLCGLGFLYFNGNYTFFNANIAFQATVGMRF